MASSVIQMVASVASAQVECCGKSKKKKNKNEWSFLFVFAAVAYNSYVWY